MQTECMREEESNRGKGSKVFFIHSLVSCPSWGEVVRDSRVSLLHANYRDVFLFINNLVFGDKENNQCVPF